MLAFSLFLSMPYVPWVLTAPSMGVEHRSYMSCVKNIHWVSEKHRPRQKNAIPDKSSPKQKYRLTVRRSSSQSVAP